MTLQAQYNPLESVRGLRVSDECIPVVLASDQPAIPVILSVDYDYGVVGPNTIRTAAQIGNATGAAAFGAGITGAQVLRVVLPTDQTAIPVSQSGTWSVLTPSFPTTVDTNYGAVSASTIRTASQIGNATGAALFGGGTTTAQVLRVVLPTDQTPIPATQSGTWSVLTPSFPTTVDTNYGAVGASTIRTASQIGNATGAAAFGAGTTTAQVIRAVLPTDQTPIPVTQSGSWTGTANQGTPTVIADSWPVYPTFKVDTTNYPVVIDTVDPANSLGYPVMLMHPGTNNFAYVDGSGNLAVIGPLTDTELRATPVPVSGTVAVTQSTSPWVVGGTVKAQLQDDSGNGIGSVLGRLDVNASQSGAWSAGRTWTLSSGTDSVASVQSGTWSVTANAGTNLNTSALALDATLLTLTLAQGGSSASKTGPMVMGVSTTAAPVYSNNQTNPLSLTPTGSLRTEATLAAGSSITVNQGTPVSPASSSWPVSIFNPGTTVGAYVMNSAPAAGDQGLVVRNIPTGTYTVSGTVTANAGTGNFTVVQATGTNLHAVLDTGSTTAVTQATAANLNATVVGASASGATKAGNPVLTSGVYNSTQPTVTNGQTVEMQNTARGAHIVATGTDTFNVTVNAALPAGTATIGVVSTKIDLTPSSPTATSVGVASAQAVASNANRKGLILTNTSVNTISIGLGATAVLNSGITLYPGGSFQMDEFCFDTGAVNAIASAASSNLAVQEFA